MFSNYSIVDTFLGSSYGIPAFDGGIRSDVSVNLFAETNGASAIVDTAKLSSAGVSNSSALHRTVFGHAPSSTSAAILLVIGPVKLGDNFVSLPYSCSL